MLLLRLFQLLVTKSNRLAWFELSGEGWESVLLEEQGFRIVFAKAADAHTSTMQVSYKYRTSAAQIAQLLSACSLPKSVRELMLLLELKNRANFMERYVAPLLRKRLLVMLNPGSPNSPKQRYIVTKKGEAFAGDLGP